MVTDDILYRRYLGGDEDSLSALMERHGDKLTLYLDGCLHDLHESEDLMIEVFAYLIAKQPRIRDGGFRAYLYRSARHMALRLLSGKRAQLCFSLDALTEELLARVPQPEKFMELRVEGGEIRLRYRDIIRAEHFAHVIYVHTTAGKTLATRQSFKAFTAPLKEDPRFFVCGRGVIVNLEHAEDFEDAAFRMEDGSRVFVSQELQKSARQSFMEYLLERGRTL
mgnify:CR=1 FL=1